MRIKSFPKINLSLRVIKKLKNGLHDIETNSALIKIFDEIDIKKNKKNKVIFEGEFKKGVNNKKNSILDTLTILKKNRIINDCYKVSVKKNIPVFAGLGGGTSNSVSIVKYFYKKKLKEKMINKFEKKIGSDFRLFLSNLSFQKKYKKVSALKINFKTYIVLVFPRLTFATKKIYKLVSAFSGKSKNQYLKNNSKQYYKNIINERNDLQMAVVKKYPIIDKLIRTILNQKGCIFSRMSGSGSTCYGVFKSKKNAYLAVKKLKKKYPKYWCVITKTI